MQRVIDEGGVGAQRLHSSGGLAADGVGPGGCCKVQQALEKRESLMGQVAAGVAGQCRWCRPGVGRIINGVNLI